jgi:hypothetical protein
LKTILTHISEFQVDMGDARIDKKTGKVKWGDGDCIMVEDYPEGGYFTEEGKPYPGGYFFVYPGDEDYEEYKKMRDEGKIPSVQMLEEEMPDEEL